MSKASPVERGNKPMYPHICRPHLANARGRILMVSMKLSGVRGEVNDVVGKNVRSWMTMLAHRGIRPSAVVPDSLLDKFDGKDKGSYYQGTIDGLSVYAVKSGLKSIYPTEEEYGQIAEFSDRVWQLARSGAFGKIGIMHGHDWPAGIVMWGPENGSNGELDRPNMVYTPYDPILYKGLISVPRDVLLRRFGDPHRGAAHLDKLSGFKSGVLSADRVTVWDLGQLEDLRTPSMTDYAGFVDTHKGKFVSLAGSNESVIVNGIPLVHPTGLTRVYYQALFGEGLNFSSNVERLPKDYVSSLQVNLTEKNSEDPRTPILLDRLRKAHPTIGKVESATKHVPNYQGPGAIKGYRGNIGGILLALKNIFADPNHNEKGIHFIFLNGGEGERGFGTTLNSCAKGELILGNSRMSSISQNTAAYVASQLPNDQGYVVIMGCDNYLMTKGPMRIGDHLLSEAKQGIILIGYPQKITGEKPEDLEKCKALGMFFTDPKTGDIKAFGEKKKTKDGHFDIEWAESVLKNLGGDGGNINTFFFIMRLDAAKAWYKVYQHTSDMLQLPLHETYDLDFSAIFTTALFTPSFADWAKMREAYEKQTKQRFSTKDWMYLWEHAQKIKEFGVGGAVFEGSFSDVGTTGEHYATIRLALDKDEELRMAAREKMELPKQSNKRCSLQNVKFSDGNHYLHGAVFKAGGEVGSNVIIINTIFENEVKIPDEAVIIGGRIFKMSFDMSDKSPRFIYCVQQDPNDQELHVKGNCTYSTVYLINGQKLIVATPLPMTGKEPIKTDPSEPDGFAKEKILNYSLNGHFTEQGLKGEVPPIAITDTSLIERLMALKGATEPSQAFTIPSVKNLKRINSLGISDARYSKLLQDIDVFVRDNPT